jgi:hypothetical protein
MGISGLLPVLKEIQVHGNISEFKGKRLAVDVRYFLLFLHDPLSDPFYKRREEKGRGGTNQ